MAVLLEVLPAVHQIFSIMTTNASRVHNKNNRLTSFSIVITRQPSFATVGLTPIQVGITLLVMQKEDGFIFSKTRTIADAMGVSRN